MQRVPLIITLLVTLLLHTGCSNGPLSRMLRGGECSQCQSFANQTYPHAHEMSGCATCGPQGSFGGGGTIGGGYIGGQDVNAPFLGQPGFSGILPGPGSGN